MTEMLETHLWATALHLSGLTLAVIGIVSMNIRWIVLAAVLMLTAIAGLYHTEVRLL